MSDTTGKTVTFKTDNGPSVLEADHIHLSLQGGNVWVSAPFATRNYCPNLTPAEVVAKLNAALNPPGPGEVTVRQIQKALKPLQGVLSDIVSLQVYEDATGVVDMDDEELVGGTGNPLAYIASLTKPAPRDELQTNHDAAIALLRHIEPQVEVSFEKWDGITAVLKRAENLKGKP